MFDAVGEMYASLFGQLIAPAYAACLRVAGDALAQAIPTSAGAATLIGVAWIASRRRAMPARTSGAARVAMIVTLGVIAATLAIVSFVALACALVTAFALFMATVMALFGVPVLAVGDAFEHLGMNETDARAFAIMATLWAYVMLWCALFERRKPGRD